MFIFVEKRAAPNSCPLETSNSEHCTMNLRQSVRWLAGDMRNDYGVETSGDTSSR